MKLILLSAILLVAPISNAAERVVLVAGGGANTNTSVPIKATEAKLDSPFGVDFDAAGNLYLVEMTGNRVRKLDKNGILTVIAGTGEKGMNDGPGLTSRLNGPHNLAISGNQVFLADTWNNCVRVLNLDTNNVERFIGTGEKGYAGDDGVAINAKFGGIYCISVGLDNKFYVADLDNARIRVVVPADGLFHTEVRNSREGVRRFYFKMNGIVHTVAGNGLKGVPAEGAKATEAPLNDPRAVIADALGQVYVLERDGHSLRMVDTNGMIRTLVGTGEKGNTGDGGSARQATLNGPKHLCFDVAGNVIIADTENHVVRKYLLRENRIVRVAGTGRKGSKGVGGPPLEVELNQPHGVYVHRDGTLYICDSSNHRVLKIERR